MRTLPLLLLALLSAAALPAQQGTKGQQATQLRQMEEKAKNDIRLLLEAARFAKDKGFPKDQERILQKVIKLDPKNEEALRALGFVKRGDQWLPKAKAEALEKADTEAEMKAKGMEWVDGVWVPKDAVADAKKGVFRHEGQLVSKFEYRQFAAGKVRHPKTGMLIAKEDAEKAATQFQLPDGKWVSEDEANKFHADVRTPWLLRTTYCNVLSNLPLADVLATYKAPIDEGYETVKQVFAGKEPSPARRPTVFITASVDEYKEFGTRFGAGGSAYGTFLADADFDIPQLGGEFRVALVNHEKDWGAYWVRHAVGMSYAHALGAEGGVELPLWFVRGVGGFAERFYTDGVAAHFGQQHIAKGGVPSMNSWFKVYDINGENEPKTNDALVFQAAFNIAFGMRGGDKQATAAMMEITNAFAKNGAAVVKAIGAYEKVLAEKEKELRTYLQQITRK